MFRRSHFQFINNFFQIWMIKLNLGHKLTHGIWQIFCLKILCAIFLNLKFLWKTKVFMIPIDIISDVLIAFVMKLQLQSHCFTNTSCYFISLDQLLVFLHNNFQWINQCHLRRLEYYFTR